ncbi:MAG: TIR domain-containing protein [Magnetovibrio sp.]|nr:TIR domain-containing protein [Magnetovibrio sp.]
MARQVFFSFHYDDIMNANIIRNSGQFKPTKETGFYDASLWEEAKTKGDGEIRKLIDNGLANTSVSCFLLGAKTSTRQWCKYELEQSVFQKKGIFGICLPNQEPCGPKWLSLGGHPVYTWDHTKFEGWVESAAQKAGR